MKIKIYLKDFRRYKEPSLEKFNKDGLKGLQEYCVCSGLNLVAMYSLLLEEVEDEEMETKRDCLVKFYNYEVVG